MHARYARRALIRALGWITTAALAAPLAFGLTPPPEALELPEVVVRGIDRVRLEAEREGVLPLEAPRLAQAPLRVDLPAHALPAPELRSAPPVQSPGCAYRNPITGALARATGGAEALYKTGLERLSRDLLDEAAAYLARVRAQHPQHPLADDAAFWLAEVRRRQGMPDEALAFLRLVHGAYAGEAAYRLAWLLSDRGRDAEAAAAWSAVAADGDSPHRAEALYRLGADRLSVGDAPGALEPLGTLEALQEQGLAPRSEVRAATLLALGLARRATGDGNGAEAALVRFLLESPDHPSAEAARVALAWTLLEAGKAREAAQRFAWIVDAHPPRDLLARALYGRVRALAELQDPAAPEALVALEAASPGGPWVGWGRADLGWLAFRAERYEEALARYRGAIDAWDAPGEAVPRYMAAETLYLLGRYGEAAAAYREVDRESPLGSAALHRAGMCELLTGRAVEASALLEEALRRDPAYPQADRVWAWLGEARLRTGLREEALRAFSAVPEHSPAIGQALYGRAWIAFDAQRWDEAADLFGRLLRTQPSDPNRDEALLTLARAHFNRRELKPALAALDRLEAETGEPRYRAAARFHRGWMYARSRREAEARQVLSLLLSDEPGGPFAARAHDSLGWLDFAAGDYSAALAHFDSVLALAPGGPLEAEARQKRADSLYNLGRHADALAAYRSLGDTPEGRYGEALCLFRLGRLTELARTAEGFAGRHPDDPRAADLFLALAQARSDAGDPAAAADAYRRAAPAAGEGDRAAEARLEAARSLLRAGKPGQARELLEPLSSSPGAIGSAALRELAQVLEDQGSPEGSRDAWDELARRTDGEDRSRALRRASRSCQALLAWDCAETRLRAALAASPPSAALLRQALQADLGEVILLAGAPDRALAPLAEAAEMGTSPDGLRAFSTLGQAQEAAGLTQEALETYLRIGYLYPLSDARAARALLRGGRLLEAQGAPDRARTVYEKVADGAEGDPAREARDLLAHLPAPKAR